MPRKRSYDFGTPLYPYARLERALAAVMSADKAAQTGPLRGRLKRVSTLGLPEARPGKGARHQYSLAEACQLALVLLIEDAGLDPTVAVAAVRAVWSRVERNVRRAADCPAENPMMIVIRTAAVSGPFRTGDPVSALPWITVAPRHDQRARTRYRKGGFKDESDNVLMLIDQDEPGWVCIHNLTAALTKLLAALAGD